MARRSVQTMQKRLREQRARRRAAAKRQERIDRKAEKRATGTSGFTDVEDPATMFGFAEEVQPGENTDEEQAEQ